ncbi:unnamed protein product [Chironomus riparius]|uniref:Uncharacterized protein n=1 Tax=Chironomus riparius TaxID=315576 RepID=A0A9N9WXH4_9DIPT|nr:unnamed protein product [Chironomus riparius]
MAEKSEEIEKFDDVVAEAYRDVDEEDELLVLIIVFSVISVILVIYYIYVYKCLKSQEESRNEETLRLNQISRTIIFILLQTYATTLVDAAIDNAQHLEKQLKDDPMKINKSNTLNQEYTKMLSRHEIEIVNPKHVNFITKVVKKPARIDEIILWICIFAGILVTLLLALYLMCITECKSEDPKTSYLNNDELNQILIKK